MSKNIIDIRSLVYKSLRSKSLGRALAQLMVLGSSQTDKIANLQATYRTLLNYYMDGTDDPERAEVIDYLTRETYELTDIICVGYIPTSYCEDSTFRQFYTPILYDTDTLSAFNTIKKENDEIKCSIAAAAIMIGCLNVFQEDKVLCLIRLCSSTHKSVRMRALTGLVITLIYHNERMQFYPQINNRLNLLFDDEENILPAQAVVKSLLRSTETERISKDISENIIPTLTKIAPELGKNNDDNNTDVPESKIYNIHDKLEDSGIADKMRSFAQLQQEGADINMPSFSQLKGFSFFNTLENWFMPFYKENQNVSSLFPENSDESNSNMIDVLLRNGSICDSDKYSLCLNIKSVPDSIRTSLLTNLKDETEASAEIETDGISADSTYINHYVQDIYRFFKLHKDRRYYTDIFSSKLDIHNMEFFRFINPNNSFLPEIASFYYSKQLSAESVDAYNKLLATDTSNLQYYKALGNCYIRLQNYDKALECWEKADIIESDQEGTIKKLAFCNKKMGNYQAAEKYYASLLASDGDNIKYLYNIAVCQIWQGKLKPAINNLYKIRFINDDVKESAEYSLYLGICLWKEDKKRDAIECFKRFSPLHELEKALLASPVKISQTETNYIIDYIRLS